MTKYYTHRVNNNITFIKVEAVGKEFYITWYSYKGANMLKSGYRVVRDIKLMSVIVIDSLFCKY